MSLPELTQERREENLRLAMQARAARAELKARMKKGEISFSAALDEPAAQRIPVKTMIASVPLYGERKAERLMYENNISYRRRVKGLGAKQRAKLIAILG